ncbi:HAMP domain-containing protein, partial [Candidatus Microgenomates bacterium]|nr:HAMP domain-containing protein [Candidatus Microgenomates bacterium]
TIAVPVIVPNTTQSITDLTTGTKRNRDESDILGVLEASFDLSKLYTDVTNLGGQNNGAVYLVDRIGTVIARKAGDKVPIGADFSNLQPIAMHKQALSTPGEQTGQLDTNFTQYEDQYKVPVMGSLAIVDVTGWSVLIQQPVNAALAGLNQIIQFALLIFIVGLFVTFPIAYVLSRRLTSPLAELVKGTEIIGQGNFDYQTPIKSHDEIADLAAAFYRMAQELKHSIQSLQKERNILEEERNKLSVIIAGIQDAVIAVDLTRHVTLINRAAEDLLGVKGVDVYGKPIDELLNLQNGTDQIDVTEYCPINPEERDGVIFAKDNLKLTKSNASELYTNVVTGKIKGGAATNLGCIITLHNVSKEMQLEEMKLDFVSMAAHELRTPLTAISGYLSVFMMENKDKFDDEQRSFLNRIGISTQRLISLVENLLNVTKIERHGMNLARKPIDWVPHVKELLYDFQNLASEQKVELHFDEPTEPIPQITIDPLKIDEVLSNLVNNAINYSKANGHVTVIVEHKGNEVITSVKDDGPGIPETALPHLFTKFFRVSGKLEQGSKGTGLGLYISKAIIEMHNGRIWVESQYGQGSTFSFALPIDTA